MLLYLCNLWYFVPLQPTVLFILKVNKPTSNLCVYCGPRTSEFDVPSLDTSITEVCPETCPRQLLRWCFLETAVTKSAFHATRHLFSLNSKTFSDLQKPQITDSVATVRFCNSFCEAVCSCEVYLNLVYLTGEFS